MSAIIIDISNVKDQLSVDGKYQKLLDIFFKFYKLPAKHKKISRRRNYEKTFGSARYER